MFKIDRRRGGSKNRSLGLKNVYTLFRINLRYNPLLSLLSMSLQSACVLSNRKVKFVQKLYVLC